MSISLTLKQRAGLYLLTIGGRMLRAHYTGRFNPANLDAGITAGRCGAVELW